jgi:hypothetical protein
MKDKPSKGRIVHYVLPAEDEHWRHGPIRPAIIVEVIDQPGGKAFVNLQVFTDGENDRKSLQVLGQGMYGQSVPGVLWRPRVSYSEDTIVDTWHWPPRE